MSIAILKGLSDSFPQEFGYFGSQLTVYELAIRGIQNLISLKVVNGSFCQRCNIGDWILSSAMDPIRSSAVTVSLPIPLYINFQGMEIKHTNLQGGFQPRLGGPVPG